MSLVRIGGFRWSAELVQWGSRGKGEHKFCGYDSVRADGRRGALAVKDIVTRTVDVRDVEAVYALFLGQTLLYIGEGSLGACLVRHYRDDEFVGRWDSFTWISPWQVKKRRKNPHEQYLARPPKTPARVTPKQLVEHIETIAIRLAEPIGNRQNPLSRQQITWLTQVVPSQFMTHEEKLNAMFKMVQELTRTRKK